MSEPRLLVTLCTYNERESIEQLIPEIHLHAPDADVLVIDDGSPDGTGEAADAMAATDKRVRVLHREKKAGLGAATLAGFRYAVEHGYAHLLNMDADFSHPPRDIPALRDCMHRTDVAMGSRYVGGGGTAGWGHARRLMSRAINFYARLLLGLATRDNSGSFRCYRVDKLRELDFERFRARGYAFQEEVLYRLKRVGSRFEEVPYRYEKRRYGTTKINWREALAAVCVIFVVRLESCAGFLAAHKSN